MQDWLNFRGGARELGRMLIFRVASPGNAESLLQVVCEPVMVRLPGNSTGACIVCDIVFVWR